MKPGRELDVLIAEKVMGVTPFRAVQSGVYQVGGFTVEAEKGEILCPPYSTDIAAAWQVAEKLGLCVVPARLEENKVYAFAGQAKLLTLTVTAHHKDTQVEIGYGVFKHEATIGDSAPHAICLAALKAVGVEV